MRAPRWARWLLARLAPADRADEVVGDLEEAHRRRVERWGRFAASVVTSLETVDMAVALIRARRDPAADASAGRLGAGRRGLGVSWLDFKLGFRMLAKYPGLTVVGGVAMAFAIWVGAGTFEFVRQVLHPALPLHEGHRVVGLHVWDAAEGGAERRVAYELARWREDLTSVERLGAFRTLERNLIAGDGIGEPIEVAEMSASGFDVARVQPLLGRTLVAADEAPGATPVVVLGHDVWTRRFGADPGVVGRAIRLGRSRATVVGVMPAGFGFPIAQSLWMPLRLERDPEPRRGPSLRLFGRLAPGATMAEAQAELAALGRRAAADHPETHEHLRPQVMPYARSILYLPDVASWGLASINVFVVLLLVLICGNVALLMFARAATRESEIVVRNALGASRGRIIAQLFVEALVLGGVAAVLGLAAAGFGLRWMLSTAIAEVVEQRLPFWFTDRLSPATIGYTVLLTLLAAGVAGVMPALKVTGRKVESRLRRIGAGGGGLQFGGIWTGVIVLQVALTVAVPVFALLVRSDFTEIRDLDPGMATEEYLAVRLELDREGIAAGSGRDMADAMLEGGLVADLPHGPDRDAFLARFRDAAGEMERRLERRADVVGVTFGDRLPGMYHPHRLVDVDEGGTAPLRPEWPAYRVSDERVAIDYFDVLDVPVLAGRGFHSGDLAEDARAVIVNESFVELVLGGRNPLGRHIQYRYLEEENEFLSRDEEPWYEIVGVVPDLGLTFDVEDDPKRAGVYHPVAPGDVYPIHMAVHATGNPAALTHAVRSLATDIEPGLRLYDPEPLDRVTDSELAFYSFWFWILVLVCGVTLLLSLTGIYAVMSFAVSRRTREIGIRVALGASPGRVVVSIFRRPLVQFGLGLATGGLLLLGLAHGMEGRLAAGDVLAIIAYLTLMAAVCSLACVVPTRRALAVEPTEALSAE